MPRHILTAIQKGIFVCSKSEISILCLYSTLPSLLEIIKHNFLNSCFFSYVILPIVEKASYGDNCTAHNIQGFRSEMLSWHSNANRSKGETFLHSSLHFQSFVIMLSISSESELEGRADSNCQKHCSMASCSSFVNRVLTSII